jgi:hypothetical protein
VQWVRVLFTEVADMTTELTTTNHISAAKVGGAVKSAINGSVKARNSIHVALCASVQYAWENKGAGLDKYMQALFQGLFDNDVKSHHEQMKAWTETNFPIKVLFDKEKLTYRVKLAKKWDNLTDDDWHFTEASEVPYFKLTSKSSADAIVGYDSLIKRLEAIASIEDKKEIKPTDKHRVHELTRAVQALVEQYKQAA